MIIRSYRRINLITYPFLSMLAVYKKEELCVVMYLSIYLVDVLQGHIICRILRSKRKNRDHEKLIPRVVSLVRFDGWFTVFNVSPISATRNSHFLRYLL